MNVKLLAFILLCGVLYVIMHDDITLFDHFVANGSLCAVLLMTYASSVCYDLIKINKNPAIAVKTPSLLRSPLAAMFILLAIPCIIWPPIYIGSYDGWLAGIIAYVLLQIVNFSLSTLFNFKNATTTFYFWTAVISCLIAYYLSYMDMTNQSIANQLQPYQTLALDQLNLLKDLLL
jgi:hypothetical protein